MEISDRMRKLWTAAKRLAEKRAQKPPAPKK